MAGTAERRCVICERPLRWKRRWWHFYLEPPPFCAPADTAECRRLLDVRLGLMNL